MAMLAGNSSINAWGPDIWSSLLGTARIIISTPQVLLDALDHAYISMDHLALIVFDEGQCSLFLFSFTRTSKIKNGTMVSTTDTACLIQSSPQLCWQKSWRQ